MLSEREKLESLAMLGTDLNQVQDLDILMERVLRRARQFSNADAGSIYIKKDHTLHFTYTQNKTLQSRLSKGEKLVYSTFSMPVNTESIAGYVATTGEVLNLVDVYKLDPSSPFRFRKQFDMASSYETHSMLTIPLRTARDDILGVLQIINAQDSENRITSFSKEDEKLMLNFAGIAAVALERAQMTRAIILRMIKMAELRDPKETGAHVNRVAGYSIEIYEKWAQNHDISEEDIEKHRDILRMAAMLHDVGKVAISDLILKKPARFNNDEYEIMKQHTVLGAQLFLDKQSEFDDAALRVALNHHERWDGNGYPGHVDVRTGVPLSNYSQGNGKARGKRADEIPLYGRIVAIADVYDALSSKRVYKDAWDESEVLETIDKDSGTHFDPEIAQIFFDRVDVIKSIQDRYKDS